MTLNDIVNGGYVLKKLLTQDLPIMTAYKLSMLVSKMNPHLQFFDEQREKLVELGPANKELLELLNQEVDFGDFEKIDFPLSADVKLSITDIQLIEKFVNFIE